VIPDREEIAYLGVAGQRRLLADRVLSARQLVSTCLERIEALEPRLNAFVSLRAAAALEEAEGVQRSIDDGTGGPLAGIPLRSKTSTT
jgi:Asp-tRNA(Asn)/Glu-tRNA(Gln) amidotransferase A subunit family amidase